MFWSSLSKWETTARLEYMSLSFERFALRWLTGGVFLLILSPLVYSSTVNQPFLFLKALLLYVVVGAMIAVYLPLAAAYPQYRPRWNALTISFTVLVGVLLVASAVGNDWSMSLWSSWSRLLGLFTILHFYALFLMLAGLARGLPWQTIIRLSIGVSAITAIVAFFQGERPGSLFGNPTFFASYLLPHIFLGAWVAYTAVRAQKYLLAYACGAAVILNTIALFLTETRAALAALVIGAIAWGITFGMQERRRIPLVIAGGLLVAGSVFFLTRNAPLWQHVPGLARFAGTTLVDLDAGNRAQTLAIAWAGVKDRVILGWGWDNFRTVFDTRYTPALLRSDTSTASFDRPHNIFFDYAIGAGFAGLIAFLTFLGAAFYGVYKIRDSLLRACLFAIMTAYVVHNFFIFDTYGSYLMLAVTLGLIENQRAREGQTENAKMSVSRAWPAWISAMLLAAVLGTVAYLHYPLLATNKAEFWAETYATNGLPDQALMQWDKALAKRTPYAGSVRKNYLDALKQLFSEGAIGPEQQARIQKALELIEKEIAKRPGNYSLRAAAADAYIVFSSLDAVYFANAENHIRQSIGLSPGRQHPYYLLAKLEVARNNPDAALAYTNKAIELDPLVGDPHFFKALTAFAFERAEIAMTALVQAEKLGRTTRNAREDRLIGGYLADAGAYDRALAYLNSALDREPSDLEALFKKGWVLYRKGNVSAARETISSFLTALPTFKTSPQYPPFAEMFRDLGL